MKRIIIIFWVSFIVFFGLVILFFRGIHNGLLGPMPDIVELENPKSELASEIYSEDGLLLGKYFLKDRTNVAHEDISEYVYHALIATEDIRFHTHTGIDFRSLARALKGAGSSGGASTITQQLAKNLFHEADYSSKRNRIIQKLKEWVISVRLERAYTKEEIITMYLNTVQFSGQSFGIKSASKEFFNKAPSELLQEEAAVLVGMLKANTMYNPRRNPQNSLERRNTVLFQLKRYKFISPNDYDSLKALPIILDYVAGTHNEGPAPYFREYLRKELAQWCKERGFNLYKDGLKIHTTLNYRMQSHAEKAVGMHLSELQKDFYKSWKGRNPWTTEKWIEIKDFPIREARKTERYRLLKKEFGDDTASIWQVMRNPVSMTLFTWEGERDTLLSPLDSVKHYVQFLQTGFVAMDPNTGQVKAWVGGINHKYFQYDHVNASATRQVGSTFKPLFYSAALYLGQDPCEYLPREETTFYIDEKTTWSPRNSDGSSGGVMNMPQALAKSDNLYTAQLMKKLGESGPRNVVDFVRKMGVDSSKLESVYSIGLGVCDISVIEMASAFSVFANKGNWIEPTYLTRIEDKNGNILQEFGPQRINQVMTEEKAFAMYKFLEGGVNHGTAYRLRFRYKIEGSVGGKTGTTQSNSDGWFVGITRDLVTATWVGCSSRAVRFRSTALGQGANTALPIFGLFLQSTMRDKQLEFKLEAPETPENPEAFDLWNCPPPETTNGKELDI